MRTDPDAQAMRIAEEALRYAALHVPSNSKAENKVKDAIATLRSRLAEGGEAAQSPGGWRFTGIAGFKRFVSDEWYQKAQPEIRKWYEPICAKCPSGPTHTAAVQAALEAAAKVCEEFSGREHDPWDYAAAIRALTPQDVLGGATHEL